MIHHTLHIYTSSNLPFLVEPRKRYPKHPIVAMEGIKSLILQGCKLAGDLESNFLHKFPSNSNQMDPNNINNDFVKMTSAKATCEEIISKFRHAIENLESYQHNPSFDYHSHYLPGPLPSSSSLRSFHVGGTPNENSINMAARGTEVILAPHGHEPEKVMMNRRLSAHIEGRGGEDPSLLRDVSSQSRKRRREDTEKRAIEVSAVEYGNAEMPPDDGHTWRKYGQKVIQESKFPRSYYRCTHQRYCDCPAKKQVKKLDHDPTKFEVIYIGQHTCHKSSTAPISASILSPQPPSFTHYQSHHQNAPHTIYPLAPPNTLLFMNFAGGEIGNINKNNMLDGKSTSGGASASHDMDSEYTVANMANGMFNSSVSNANNMDWIFQAAKGKDKNKN